MTVSPVTQPLVYTVSNVNQRRGQLDITPTAHTASAMLENNINININN